MGRASSRFELDAADLDKGSAREKKATVRPTAGRPLRRLSALRGLETVEESTGGSDENRRRDDSGLQKKHQVVGAPRRRQSEPLSEMSKSRPSYTSIKLKRSAAQSAKKFSSLLGPTDSSICDTCLDQILSPISGLDNTSNNQSECSLRIDLQQEAIGGQITVSADTAKRKQRSEQTNGGTQTVTVCDNHQAIKSSSPGFMDSFNYCTCFCSDYCFHCKICPQAEQHTDQIATIYDLTLFPNEGATKGSFSSKPSQGYRPGSSQQQVATCECAPVLISHDLLENSSSCLAAKNSSVDHVERDKCSKQANLRAKVAKDAKDFLLCDESFKGSIDNHKNSSNRIKLEKKLDTTDLGVPFKTATNSNLSHSKNTENLSAHSANDAATVDKPVGSPDSSQRQAHRSHMDWKNISKRYRKMPYQHKGLIWWRLRQSCFCHLILSSLNFLFPIFTSFKNYSIPTDLVADLVCGFTIAILHIPQGMAYGLLAGVEPIHGLYVSMVPVLIMALMSRSPHMSYGTFAVISIMLANSLESIKQTLRQQVAAPANLMSGNQSSVFSVVELTSDAKSMGQLKQHDLSAGDETKEALIITNNHKSIDPGQQLLRNLLISSRQLSPAADEVDRSLPSPELTTAEFIMPSNIEILTCICLLAGIIQIVMALMRLGVLSLMFSDQLVSSFTTASAIQVATSQLGSLFDLSVPRVPDGLFKVCRTWWAFGMKFADGFNEYTAFLTLFSLLFLINVKEVIEPLMRRRCKMATCIPSELVLMFVLVVCSWFWQFNTSYGILIVGDVPTGLPMAKAPRLDLVPLVIQDAFTIAVISFAMNLSLAQVYAKKFRYRLDPNQELFALGTSNLVGSFFSCFPCAASLSRTAVQSNLKAKSPICSLFSCAIVVAVICYFAPFFHNLPRSTLSCIIVVALKGILFQVRDFFESWHLSKLDALVWLATFVSVLAFDVTYGLVLGILTSLSMVFYRLLTPNYSILGQLPDTEIYVDKSAFAECTEIDQVKIFRFNSALCYLNRDMFKSSIERLLQSANNNMKLRLFCSAQQKQLEQIQTGMGCALKKVEYLIIDCSGLSYCDYSGVATLIEIIEELNEQNIAVYLAACPLKLINMIEKLQKPNVLDHNVYPSITDAISQIRFSKNNQPREKSSSMCNLDGECLESVISSTLK